MANRLVRFIRAHGHTTRRCTVPGYVEVQDVEDVDTWYRVKLDVNVVHTWLGY